MRSLLKATHVPLVVSTPSTGAALVKYGYARRLDLQPGEVERVRGRLAESDDDAARTLADDPALGILAPFEFAPGQTPLPARAEFAAIPLDSLRAFGQALAEVRRRDAAEAGEADQGVALARLRQATVATESLSAYSHPVGMLNLERLEMVPAGIERGELLATIPLAPLEETAVTQKAWSVTSKEFTSIVTDSLENYSETGVTDSTELAQSSTSQAQHSNQANITGTVSGGIPLISGSSTAGFTDQNAQSQSATDSRKHATSLTQKASSRSKQEHKVTISTVTVTGTAQTTTRTLKNPSASDPIRVDYFSMMRKWRVRLYRYGLRLTYDMVVPEPGSALRRAHAELEQLRGQLRPFEFHLTHSAITPGNFQDLAAQYGAQVPEPPATLAPYVVSGILPNPAGHGINDFQLPLDIKTGHKVVSLKFSGGVTGLAGVHFEIAVVGTDFHKTVQDDQVYPPTLLLDATGGQLFLKGATGNLNVAFYFHDCSSAIMQITVETAPDDAAMAQWRSDVWGALYNAAQTQYYARQQDIANQITAIEERLASVDTLSLRREESDEIMKTVLRFMLGTGYEFMPASVVTAFKNAGTDMSHGIEPDGNTLPLSAEAWSTLMGHEEIVKFVNEAIEWENVVTFLYSYFWDIPDSWEFIRNIQHPDPTRQAFLRAGSARVVLTVRKGWEEAWVNFVEGGGSALPPGHPYLTIAQEIAAYDDRNYPGIPPANSARAAARLEESVYTTATDRLAPSQQPVPVKVASSAGFVVGLPVLIDTADTAGLQESQLVVAVPDATHVVVAKLAQAHGGTGTPYPMVQPGEKGALIAEWNEYTPTSGTDIALTSNLSSIS